MTAHHSEDLARSIPQLRAEHEVIDQRLEDLRARAATNDWRYLDEVWDELADELEAHFLYEEEVVFPELRRVRDDGAALATRLCMEHEKMRSDLGLIGVQIQLHNVIAATVDTLVERLREHAALEGRLLYPWAQSARATA